MDRLNGRLDGLASLHLFASMRSLLERITAVEKTSPGGKENLTLASLIWLYPSLSLTTRKYGAFTNAYGLERWLLFRTNLRRVCGKVSIGRQVGVRLSLCISRLQQSKIWSAGWLLLSHLSFVGFAALDGRPGFPSGNVSRSENKRGAKAFGDAAIGQPTYRSGTGGGV